MTTKQQARPDTKATKRRYQKPRLEELGNVRELTLTAPGTQPAGVGPQPSPTAIA